MPPKASKKKAGKPLEKKSAKLASIPMLEVENEFDDPELLGGEGSGAPIDQLELTHEELNKDVTIILRADNPYFTDEFVEFSFKDLEYRPLGSFSDSLTFFSQTGTMIHKDLSKSMTNEGDEREDEVAPLKNGEAKRKNKFNFCHRAVQTMNMTLREQCLQTEPPAEAKLQFNAALWDITFAYDSSKDLKKNEEVQQTMGNNQFPRNEKANNDRLEYTTRILDRMVNQNRFFDVIIDFSFYDNPCDEFLEQGLGSLLPLWKFSFRDMKGITITDFSWNPHYADMFAAAFGTTEFLHDQSGCICIYSLKSTSHPERVFMIDTVVQCVDFSKTSPYLLAAGFGDGRVAVFDLRHSDNIPIATSQCCTIEHNDAVFQVKWLADNIDEQQNFCSVSADGKVINWYLAKSELVPYEVINMKNQECTTEGPEGFQMDAVSCGTCISFNDDSTDLFLVGTEEGLIHKCSGLYTQQYLFTYRGHSNTLYSVEWNPYHPRVFLTCSADWTIQVWDHKLQDSVFFFDMFNEVKTATWAPFSSTLFAAITKDGKVHVFDLMMNRQQPTCSYSVYSPKKHIMLTTVSFNPKKPILVVGDERGCVVSFKLSPNLRSSLKGLTELEESKFVASEIDKMEKVLKLAQSPENKEKMII